MARDCDTERYVASAKEKAIACLSTGVKIQWHCKIHSEGNPQPSAEPSAFSLRDCPLPPH